MVSMSMTMNGAVLPILALYIVAAEEQGVDKQSFEAPFQMTSSGVHGSQHYLVHQSFPCASSRTFLRTPLPRCKVVHLDLGLPYAEAGATADLVAYTLADGLAYVRSGLAAGLDIDAFAPRLSFFWGIGMDPAIEIASQGRTLFVVERSQPLIEEPKSLALRTHCQTSGWSLTAQDVYNNVTRTAVEAMAAVMGHTQSLHTNSLDEALALPTDFSARIARNTQLLLQQEAGLCQVVDPWGGSVVIEDLTRQLIDRAREHLAEIESLGGMPSAIEQGLPKQRIEEAAARTQARIDTGSRSLLGSTSTLLPNKRTYRCWLLTTMRSGRVSCRCSQNYVWSEIRLKSNGLALGAAQLRGTERLALSSGPLVHERQSANIVGLGGHLRSSSSTEHCGVGYTRWKQRPTQGWQRLRANSEFFAQGPSPTHHDH